MSKQGNDKKKDQLGEPYGTAVHRLRKNIMFALLGLENLNTCFQCNEKIEHVEQLSIEHKVPWLDSEDPKKFFFDLSNIAFSHLSCNSAAARPVNKKYFTPEEQYQAQCEYDKTYRQRHYTKDKRHQQYLRTGK